MKIIVITGNGNDRCYRLMADSTMLVSNKPFFIPDFAPEFVLHPALAVRIDRLGKNIAPRFAHRYYQSASACAVVEAKVEAQFAHLDARYTAFDGAFMLGKALPITDLDADGGLKVQTRINDDQSLSTSRILHAEDGRHDSDWERQRRPQPQHRRAPEWHYQRERLADDKNKMS